ncbi:hypothetical protein KSS87_006828 [Heliosperma pusillum]|nr:hypothetical protein KSS87_006828 [Heliosperma pusillum]
MALQFSWINISRNLLLAYQSVGVVYGDLSTSPLYVYTSTFKGNRENYLTEDVVFGAFSLIFWTLTLIPLLKYVIIVLSADDNGEGGTFALYSLLCRHAKFSLLPNQQAADEELSTYKYGHSGGSIASPLKRFLEKNKKLRTALLLLVLFGASMVIGDGVLTPAISVLSSVSGLRVAVPNIKEGQLMVIACAILVGLFALQHCGTHKVAFLFAPVVLIWLFSIFVIGLYNTIHWNPKILHALSPHYIARYFKQTGKDGWISLGGILLCITDPVFWPVFVVATLAAIVGSQAIITATFSIVKQCHALGCFPRVKVVHTSKHIYGQIYIPEINWILMILTLSVTIGFRDTTLIGHAYDGTSHFLVELGLTMSSPSCRRATTLTTKLPKCPANGGKRVVKCVACMTVLIITSCLMAIVITFVWQKGFFALPFLLFFGFIEGMYLSSAFTKVPQGGWVPIMLSFVFMLVMYVWHFGTRKKYNFDLHNKVSLKWILGLGPSLGIVRVPGIGLIYSDLATGVPAIFSHFVTNLPAYHKVLVFVCVKSVPVPYVSPEERFLIGRVCPRPYRMYRCIVRYGYKDTPRDDGEFENLLIQSIAEFILMESVESRYSGSDSSSFDGRMAVISTRTAEAGSSLIVSEHGDQDINDMTQTSRSVTLQSLRSIYEDESVVTRRRRVRFQVPQNPAMDPAVREELVELTEAKEAGVAYIMGHSYVKARRSSSFLKKLAIDIGYSFLRKNCRGPAVALNIPHISLIEVGMIYYV